MGWDAPVAKEPLSRYNYSIGTMGQKLDPLYGFAPDWRERPKDQVMIGQSSGVVQVDGRTPGCVS